MNMSRVVSSLISQLGLYSITLPFNDPTTKSPIPTETIIHQILVDTTIPMFSQYQPWIREGEINIIDLKCIDRNNHIYMLPGILTTTEILYVVNVDLPVQNNRGTYGDISPSYGINRSVQGVITGMEYMMLAGQMRSEPTFEYLGHNKIRLYGYPRTEIVIKVACCHEPNGETIEESTRAAFIQLATLDVKEFLYNNLKYYNDLPSAFGNVKLMIEEFSSATSDKASLLKEWDDTFHLDIVDYIEWM